jgi:hypothetical protein
MTMAMNNVTIKMKSFRTQKGAVDFVPCRSAPAYR